jgi:hypothetical protein
MNELDVAEEVVTSEQEAARKKRWAEGRARQERNLEIDRAAFKRWRHIRGLFNNPALHGKRQGVNSVASA